MKKEKLQVRSNMIDIAVIIPVHEYNDTVKKYLVNAINSVVDRHVYIVCPKEISAVIEVDVTENVTVMSGAKDSNFQSLVNYGFNNLQGEEWASILEFDDEYASYWFDEVERYITDTPDVSVFIPLTDLFKEIDGKTVFVGYGNEAPLASAFSNELEYIDHEILSNYFDFYMTGSVFNVSDYLSVGGLKESMKLTFWYEFLLRLTYKDKKVRVIPKVGYRHLIDREGSIYRDCKENMTQEEGDWWYDLAKTEYRYTSDRNKQYVKKEEEED